MTLRGRLGPGRRDVTGLSGSTRSLEAATGALSAELRLQRIGGKLLSDTKDANLLSGHQHGRPDVRPPVFLRRCARRRRILSAS